jgi:cell division septation protein DedD
MTSSTDTEITLGTGKLLFLFFFLVGICSLFFALGYSLGRKSDTGIITASAASTPQTSTSATKPAGGDSPQQPPMSFYKSVEQKEASTELTESATKTAPADALATGVSQPAPNTPEAAAPATGGYFVQVAAVSKQDDAEALVDALKKKQYPAFVASGSGTDKLFRVQLGPFADIKDAEAQRTRLISDGYNPILKK